MNTSILRKEVLPLEEGIYQYENCVECHRSGEEIEDEHEGSGLRGLQGRAGDYLRGSGRGSGEDGHEGNNQEEREKDDD